MVVRAKLPEGPAVWPAFWLLGADFATTPWPGCGEIDVLEKMGRLNYHMACACTHNGAPVLHAVESGEPSGRENTAHPARYN